MMTMRHSRKGASSLMALWNERQGVQVADHRFLRHPVNEGR